MHVKRFEQTVSLDMALYKSHILLLLLLLLLSGPRRRDARCRRGHRGPWELPGNRTVKDGRANRGFTVRETVVQGPTVQLVRSVRGTTVGSEDVNGRGAP